MRWYTPKIIYSLLAVYLLCVLLSNVSMPFFLDNFPESNGPILLIRLFVLLGIIKFFIFLGFYFELGVVFLFYELWSGKIKKLAKSLVWLWVLLSILSYFLISGFVVSSSAAGMEDSISGTMTEDSGMVLTASVINFLSWAKTGVFILACIMVVEMLRRLKMSKVMMLVLVLIPAVPYIFIYYSVPPGSDVKSIFQHVLNAVATHVPIILSFCFFIWMNKKRDVLFEEKDEELPTEIAEG